MKKHSIGKLITLVMVLALSFALVFAFSTIASADEGESENMHVTAAYGDVCGRVQVKWTAVENAAYYDIYCDAIHVAHIDTAYGNLTSFILTGITANDHVFTLVATDSAENVLATYQFNWDEKGLFGESMHAFVEHSMLPTCEDEGYTYYICDCGANYVDINSIIAPLGHDWGAWSYNADGTHTRVCKTNTNHTETGDCVANIDAPTCTENKVCTVCSGLLASSIGHDWSEWSYNDNGTHTKTCANDPTHVVTNNCTPNISKPTCTDDKVCTVCDGVLQGKIGHAPGAAATCTTAQICTRPGCGAVITPALGHTAGTPADCTNNQTCTVCHEILVYAYGHNYTAPTCEEAAFCTVCSETKPGSKPLGHTWGKWVYDGNGTYDERGTYSNNGSHTRTCSVCYKTDTEHCTKSADATCTNRQYCTVCNGTLVENIGHVYSQNPTRSVAATCTTAACDIFKCYNCSEERIVETTGPLGHNYKETRVPATCTEDGTSTYVCRVCGHKYVETIKSTGHDWRVIVEQKATLFKCGYEHTECSVCHERTETVEIPRLTKLTDEQLNLIITIAVVLAAATIIILLIRLYKSNRPYTTTRWIDRRRHR